MGKTNILNLIKTLPEVARKNNWVKTYDKELDYFCWSKNHLSKDVKAIKVSQEVLFFVNSKRKIEGFGIEYLKTGFIQHNPHYKDLTKFFTEEIGEGIFTISPAQEKKVAKDFVMLTNDLARDVSEESFGKDRTSRDFEELFSEVFK